MFRDLLNHLRAGWNSAWDYKHRPPSAWANSQVRNEQFWDNAANTIGSPISATFKVAMGLVAAPAVIAGAMGMAAGETALRAAGRIVAGRGLAAAGAAGGVAGIGTSLSLMAGGLGFMALDALRIGEHGFRAAMTGNVFRKGFMAPNAMDAYFPFMKHSVQDVGIAKFAPNPSIIRRATAVTLATAGIRAFAGELFSPGAPMPSIYVDQSGNTRHKSDWGADAGFAASMMGNGSDFNMSKNEMLRMAMYM